MSLFKKTLIYQQKITLETWEQMREQMWEQIPEQMRVQKNEGSFAFRPFKKVLLRKCGVALACIKAGHTERVANSLHVRYDHWMMHKKRGN